MSIASICFRSIFRSSINIFRSRSENNLAYSTHVKQEDRNQRDAKKDFRYNSSQDLRKLSSETKRNTPFSYIRANKDGNWYFATSGNQLNEKTQTNTQTPNENNRQDCIAKVFLNPKYDHPYDHFSNTTNVQIKKQQNTNDEQGYPSTDDYSEWVMWRMKISHQLCSIIIAKQKTDRTLPVKHFPQTMKPKSMQAVISSIKDEVPPTSLDKSSYLIYGIPRAFVPTNRQTLSQHDF